MKDIFIFIGIIFLLFISSNSKDVINLHPASFHQWRQSDCASYVKTFYRNNTPLWLPGTFNLAGKEGRVASELPIIYFISAKIQKVFGEHYYVIRGLNFLIFIFGLFALFKIAKSKIKNPFLIFFPVILIATSPFYYYYGLNLLPNVPAISLAFLGLYGMVLYDKNKERNEKNPRFYFIAALLAFSFATLIKPTDAGIILLAYMGMYFTKAFFYKKSFHLRKHAPQIFLLIFVGLLNFFWIKYVNHYNDLNGNHQNLVGIYPIWDLDKDAIRYTYERILNEWRPHMLHRGIMYLLGMFVLTFVVFWKKLNIDLKLLTLFLFLGVIGYSILWYKAFTDHDYYQLVFVIPSVFLAITICEFLDKRMILQKGILKTGIPIIVISFSFLAFFHNRNIQKARYENPEYRYINEELYSIEPFLRSIGVSKDAAVVCVPDLSPNMSLNAINNYGYTEEFNNDKYNINLFVKKDASFLIISDSSYLTKDLYTPFLEYQIGMQNGIYIFDLRPYHPKIK